MVYTKSGSIQLFGRSPPLAALDFLISAPPGLGAVVLPHQLRRSLAQWSSSRGGAGCFFLRAAVGRQRRAHSHLIPQLSANRVVDDLLVAAGLATITYDDGGGKVAFLLFLGRVIISNNHFSLRRKGQKINFKLFNLECQFLA